MAIEVVFCSRCCGFHLDGSGLLLSESIHVCITVANLCILAKNNFCPDNTLLFVIDDYGDDADIK